jgi:hypothetical protein
VDDAHGILVSHVAEKSTRQFLKLLIRIAYLWVIESFGIPSMIIATPAAFLSTGDPT